MLSAKIRVGFLPILGDSGCVTGTCMKGGTENHNVVVAGAVLGQPQ